MGSHKFLVSKLSSARALKNGDLRAELGGSEKFELDQSDLYFLFVLLFLQELPFNPCLQSFVIFTYDKVYKAHCWSQPEVKSPSWHGSAQLGDKFKT